MASEQLTGAALLFKVLQQHQVNHVFGYPGGAIMPIYDALAPHIAPIAGSSRFLSHTRTHTRTDTHTRTVSDKK